MVPRRAWNWQWSGPWVVHLEGGSGTCGALVCDSRPQAVHFLFLQLQRKIQFGGLVGVLGPQTRFDLVKQEASVPAAALGRCLCVRLLGNPKLWKRDKAVGPT